MKRPDVDTSMGQGFRFASDGSVKRNRDGLRPIRVALAETSSTTDFYGVMLKLPFDDGIRAALVPPAQAKKLGEKMIELAECAMRLNKEGKCS